MLYFGFTLFVGIVFITSMFFCKKPNTRWFIKGNIKVWGNIGRDQKASYYALEVGNENVAWFECPPNLCLAIGNHLMQAAHIKASELLQLENVSARDTSDRRWPAGTRVCSIGAYSFWIYDEKIYHMVIEMFTDPVSGKIVEPTIANQQCSIKYNFPLTEQDIRLLLGKPDEIKDFFRH